MSRSETVLHLADTAVHADNREYPIDRLLEPLRWLFRWGSLVMLVAMISLTFVQVISREVFTSPIMGAEELTRFMLINAVFLAFPYVVSSGANIRMEEIVGLGPSKFVLTFKFIAAVAAAVTFAILAGASGVAIMANLDNSTPTLGIPYWVFLGSALLSFSMTTVECAVQAVKVIQRRPLFITFAEEQEPEAELDFLENALK